MAGKPMKRFEGCWLGDSPHIVVLGSRKLGNFIATLPLLQGLRKKYPNCILDFWGSEVTKDFEVALMSKNTRQEILLNWRISWDGGIDIDDLAKYRKERGKPELLINCDGFNSVTAVLASLISPNWVCGNTMKKSLKGEMETGEHIYHRFLDDKEWDSRDFLSKYKNHFNTQYIGELFCRMAFIDPTEKDLKTIELPTKPPNFVVPEILIHCTSTRSAKLWKIEYWLELLSWCEKENLQVGLIGASEKTQQDEYNSGNCEEELIKQYGSKGKNTLIDLRGKTSLIELAGACQLTKAVVTVDAGPLHVAAAVKTPVMAIVGNDRDGVGASPIRLWLPRAENVFRTESSEHCALCMDNRYKNSDCLIEKHSCMEGVSSEQVIKWLKKTLI